MSYSVEWYYWVLMIGAIASTYNAFLQHYDILWCRWHDCGNKNSKEVKDDENGCEEDTHNW